MNETSHKEQKELLITKASGEQEAFSINKFKRSLRNSGASEEAIEFVTDHIWQLVHPGMSTRKIYARAFALLRKHHKPSAIKYRLKQAILEIGPTGYPFESLCGQIFENEGYKTEVGVVVDGICVTHEMDVIATNDTEQHLVECKYHSDQGKQVSVQVPLYVRSRVNDIVDKRRTLDEYKHLKFTVWVVTNTRFSSDSIDYGTCAGLKMLAWDYPSGHALKDLIERYKLFPVTILQALNRDQKKYLLEKGIVTCAELLRQEAIIKELHLSHAKTKALNKELQMVCE